MSTDYHCVSITQGAILPLERQTHNIDIQKNFVNKTVCLIGAAEGGELTMMKSSLKMDPIKSFFFFNTRLSFC